MVRVPVAEFQLNTSVQQLLLVARVSSEPVVGSLQEYENLSCDLSYDANAGLLSILVVNFETAARVNGLSGLADSTTERVSL